MELHELCDTVNQILSAEGIEIENGRTSSSVTPRNVRYYRTIGLMPAPKRLDSKSTYDDSHVQAVLSIKRSQMTGLSLKEISDQQISLEFAPVLSELVSSLQLSSLSLNLQSLPSISKSISHPVNTWLADPLFGWSVKIGDSQLSGFNTPPTTNQLAAIKKILEVKDEEGDKTSRGGDD